jgi:hypothetical protein
MRKCFIIFCCAFISFTAFAQRNLFSTIWNEAELDRLLVTQWQPYPVYTSRAAWGSLPGEARNHLIADGALLLGKPYPVLPLTEYLRFVRDGNRDRYESIYFSRRSQLLQVLMAECIEGKGRFRDDILNGVWALCEETSWCIPAHIGQKEGIPVEENPVVDLFAAETAALLAWTDYLYGSELERISPLVRQRVRKEIQNRVLKPFLERNDFWWMGFDGSAVNNWNPWILSNILPTGLLIEDDRTIRLQLVAKSLHCLNNFTNGYPDDGGCDEGPSYWGRAGGSLFDCLETLYSASEGKINYYSNPLIRNIGQYIYRAFIHNPWYINFADASARIEPDAFLIYRYGRRIGDEMLSAFGAQLDSGEVFTVARRLQSIGRSLPHLFGLKEIRAASQSWPYIRDTWLPDLQVAAARTRAGSPEGLFFAAKGGHNGESHNHNDVGSFILYYNGQPVIIDAGVGAYTAKTFSADRYSIWSMQSQYHNLPTINGIMQEAGASYAAREVTYTSDENSVRFSLELSHCYPEAASVDNWQRTYEFRRGKELAITDNYRLKEIKGITSWNFITCLKPQIMVNGYITLSANGIYKTDQRLLLRFPNEEFSVKIEEMALPPADGYQWESNLYRIVFIPNLVKFSSRYRFAFQAEGK